VQERDINRIAGILGHPLTSRAGARVAPTPDVVNAICLGSCVAGRDRGYILSVIAGMV
jgi:hypothetical protein